MTHPTPKKRRMIRKMSLQTLDSVFTIGIIADIVIVAILLINAISGAKKGFVYTIYRFFRLIIAFASAYFFAKPLAAIIKATPFHEKLVSNLESSLGEYLENAVSGIFSQNTAVSESAASSEKLSALQKYLGIDPEAIAHEYSKLMEQKAENATESIKDYILAPFTDGITTAISFVLIFVASLLALYIVMKILDLIAGAPVINGINRTLGGISGIVVGIIQIFVITIILDALLPLAGAGGILAAQELQNSRLYSILLSVNPVALLIAVTA